MFRSIVSGIALTGFVAVTSSAQVTQRVSVDAAGAQADSLSDHPAISADGRYVAFTSYATNLVPGDTNGVWDIFVCARPYGTTQRVSVSSSGVQGNAFSRYPAISANGRYVAFKSNASNLVPGDTNGLPDVFVHHIPTGTTTLVSVDYAGVGMSSESEWASVSGDGRYVAFATWALNALPNDTNGLKDIFVRDLDAGTTTLVSVSSGGTQGNAASDYPSISDDGRYVAFWSGASNLVPGDTNLASDIFVRDLQNGTTTLVSVDSMGALGIFSSDLPVISATGRYVAFSSYASNLVPGDVNGERDVFLHDLLTGTTTLVSQSSGGVQGDGTSGDGGWVPSVSADGRYVAFSSDATNLVPGDLFGHRDVFVRDVQAGDTFLATVSSSGAQANQHTTHLDMSDDGRYVAFSTEATNLVPGDTNASMDVFVREPDGGTDFTSLCSPGIAGVIACPCANPPSGPGAGCDNSSATGGAVLTGGGGAYLSSDSLFFTTSGEKPTALSIVLQGPAFLAIGAVYGQGVRCVGGALKRLFVKSASGGSITAPDFGAGDPSVSARSAATGDAIGVGQSRWYLVYYRDATVLGGCPSISTFNATQTGRVTWSP